MDRREFVQGSAAVAAKNRGWDTLIMGIRDGAAVRKILGIPEDEILTV